MPTPTIDELRALGLAAGLCAVGAASAEPFDEVRSELQRRRYGLAADVQFTYRNPARSTDPDRTLPGAASLIVGAYDYQRTAPPMPADVPVARVAAYSWEDHYAVLRAALEPIAEALRNAGHRATVIADQNHLVDRPRRTEPASAGGEEQQHSRAGHRLAGRAGCRAHRRISRTRPRVDGRRRLSHLYGMP